MSNKHKKLGGEGAYYKMGELTLAAEHKIIKHDLIRVVILNAIYLAAILIVFYLNSKHNFLEQGFSKLFHF